MKAELTTEDVERITREARQAFLMDPGYAIRIAEARHKQDANRAARSEGLKASWARRRAAVAPEG